MNKRVRVNVTIEKELLEKAKKRLNMFGGKISALFNAYLRDFVNTMDKEYASPWNEINTKIKELEERVKKLERRMGA